MSLLKWKKFNFYNLVLNTEFSELHATSNFVAQCYNDSYKVFCDSMGVVFIYSRNWESISFQTNAINIKCCALTTTRNLLVIVSQRECNNELFVQVFNLSKITKRSGALCMGSARLTSNSSPAILKACLVDNVIIIAVGLLTGDILLHRAIINRDMSSYFQSISICDTQIVGIEFIQKEFTHMFICTKKIVCFYLIKENNNIHETKVVLEVYNDLKIYCSSRLRYKDLYFLVGRDDAVYCFTYDGRGPCYAIEGKKKNVAWLGTNLIVVIELEEIAVLPNPVYLLIIIDVHSKIIVFRKLISHVEDIFVDDTHFYVLTKKNQLYVVRDRDLESKVRLLSSKNLFDVALRLLENKKGAHDKSSLMLQFGDYLYQRGDIDGALEKYIESSGTTEPYCIIQKFLDSKFNKYLSQYLTNLVQLNAGTNVEELLLNCKKRLYLSSKIDRDCNYTNVFSACCLEYSLQYNLCTFLQNVHIDDKQDLHKINSFLKNSDNEIFYNLLMENGYSLMSHSSLQVTTILKAYCVSSTNLIRVKFDCPERFISLLAIKKERCIDFLEHLVAGKFCNTTICTFLLRMYLNDWQKSEKTVEDILRFIKSQETYFCPEQIMILCRIFEFWPGALYFFDNCNLEQMCLRHCLKCNECEDIIIRSYSSSYINSNIWLQSFGKLICGPTKSITIVNNILELIFKTGHQPIMQMLRGISSNDTFKILHIKSVLLQKDNTSCLNKYFALVKVLEERLKKLEEVLQSLNLRPIEFRNHTCDSCRQQLKFPAIYFACQHSFHKECLSPSIDENTCINCSSLINQKSLNKLNIAFGNPLKFNLFPDAIKYISQIIFAASLKWSNKEHESAISNQNIFNISKQFEQKHIRRPQITSFFDKKVQRKEYDCNLNPFI